MINALEMAQQTALAVNSRVIGTDSNEEANSKATTEILASLHYYTERVLREEAAKLSHDPDCPCHCDRCEIETRADQEAKG